MERIRKVLMICGFGIAALQAEFAILPSYAAESANAPFDAKSAAEFMSANPDFKKCAADFESRAEKLYAENKFTDAAASYFAAKFFDFLAQTRRMYQGSLRNICSRRPNCSRIFLHDFPKGRRFKSCRRNYRYL